MGKQRARRFCKWMAILTDERVERRDGSNGHIWVGGGWLVGAGLSRTGTGQPGASNSGSVHEFRPQCVAVAEHAVCKPGQWESMVVAERQNHNGARTVAANSLRDDPVLIKFSSCWRFLSTMLGSGIFADNANCD